MKVWGILGLRPRVYSCPGRNQYRLPEINHSCQGGIPFRTSPAESRIHICPSRFCVHARVLMFQLIALSLASRDGRPTPVYHRLHSRWIARLTVMRYLAELVSGKALAGLQRSETRCGV